MKFNSPATQLVFNSDEDAEIKLQDLKNKDSSLENKLATVFT